MLKVLYNGIPINNGNIISCSQTRMKPNIFFDFSSNKYYTLIMIDLDIKNNYWLQWLVTNITINSKDIIIDYNEPSPPLNSGDHRYIFILFDHNNIINITESLIYPFNLSNFIKTYNLHYLYKNYFIVKSTA